MKKKFKTVKVSRRQFYSTLVWKCGKF